MEEGRGFGEVKGQAETQHVDSCSVKRITDEDFLSQFSSEISLTVSLSSQFFPVNATFHNTISNHWKTSALLLLIKFDQSDSDHTQVSHLYQKLF